MYSILGIEMEVGDCIFVMRTNIRYNSTQRCLAASLFREAKEYHPAIRLLLKAGLGDVLLEQITAHALKRGDNRGMIARYEAILWAGVVYNVLINWVLSGAGESVEDMAKTCMKISCDSNRKK